jgi:zinc transport system substrate-binding protein
MKKILIFLIGLVLLSCGRSSYEKGGSVITVSIPPFKYFVEAIGGDDFTVNVMVPAGASPHNYEPVPEQVNMLSRSLAYISNGYLGFEITWLDRFYETNREMKKLNLGEKIDLIAAEEHSGHDHEGADPHYWVSPACAMIMASSVKELLCELKPEQKQSYETNYAELVKKIKEIDIKARELFSGVTNKTFMIFHPTLGYLARDYGLTQVAVESEGKEPSPAQLKSLIDTARENNLRHIFVQKGFDEKNARAIASDTGADLMIIDPMMENWPLSTLNIVEALHTSLNVGPIGR